MCQIQITRGTTATKKLRIVNIVSPASAFQKKSIRMGFERTDTLLHLLYLETKMFMSKG